MTATDRIQHELDWIDRERGRPPQEPPSHIAGGLRTAMIIAFAAGPLTRHDDTTILAECGAPLFCFWCDIERASAQGFMIISKSGEKARAELTPAGERAVEEIIGPIKARRIKSGAA